MIKIPYVSLLLCVTLKQERPQWTVSQALHEVARDTRVDQPGRVHKPFQVGHWSSGTRRWGTTTTKTWHTCSTEKAKLTLVNKKWGARAVERILQTNVLGPVQQASYEVFRFAIGFIHRFFFAIAWCTQGRAKTRFWRSVSFSGQTLANLRHWC